MSTLSLDLRGVGTTRAVPREATARGAGISLLLHGASVSALVLVPLLGSTDPPETANAIETALVQPITVTLPPAPMSTPRAPLGSSKPRSVQAAVSNLKTPENVPTSLRQDTVLDLQPGPISDAPSSGDLDGKGVMGGDCPLGSLCGPAVAPIPDPTPKTVVIGGLIREPRLVEGRPPVYPPIAQAAGIAGKVVLEAHVGRDGRVREVRITQGHTLFDEAALASVRSRRYEPLLMNGVPTDFLITFTITFNVRPSNAS